MLWRPLHGSSIHPHESQNPYLHPCPNSYRDASTVPANAPLIPSIALMNDTDYGGANQVLTLASNFAPQTGEVTFTVPTDIAAGTYFVECEFKPSRSAATMLIV